MADENSWRTAAFRQSVVAKIDEAIRQSGMNTSRNSLEMENHVFQKAKNKEEYLGYVARLILHVREMKSIPNALEEVNQIGVKTANVIKRKKIQLTEAKLELIQLQREAIKLDIQFKRVEHEEKLKQMKEEHSLKLEKHKIQLQMLVKTLEEQ